MKSRAHNYAHNYAWTLISLGFVWTDKASGIWLCDVNLSRTVTDLFVSTGKSCGKSLLSRQTKFVCPVYTSDDLFVSDDLSVPQTICLSSSVKTAILKANPKFSVHTMPVILECVWNKLDLGNHEIIITTLFLKSFVVKIFSTLKHKILQF